MLANHLPLLLVNKMHKGSFCTVVVKINFIRFLKRRFRCTAVLTNGNSKIGVFPALKLPFLRSIIVLLSLEPLNLYDGKILSGASCRASILFSF